jgi:A/G-specific adenine glycosylase
MNKIEFQEIVWQKGRELYRTMPWRDNINPYYILVSELMLQQTQVDRVIPKFNDFIYKFPDINTLALSSLADVLTLWNGLGYNRRARFLHNSAKKIMEEFGGKIPETLSELITLPGVGPNTAGAILVYACNQPVIFIETNIRSVYFYHFFLDSAAISDNELAQVMKRTIDTEHPREFFWALMDYGVYLKKQGAGQISKSEHYKKQSPLKGSLRETRGQIVRALTARDMDEQVLRAEIDADNRFELALKSLKKDGLVSETSAVLHLTK